MIPRDLSPSSAPLPLQSPLHTQEEASAACKDLRGMSRFIQYAKLRHFLKDEAIAGKRLFTFELFFKAVNDGGIAIGDKVRFLLWSTHYSPFCKHKNGDSVETTLDHTTEHSITAGGDAFLAHDIEAIELVESVGERFQKQVQQVEHSTGDIPKTVFSKLFVGLLRQHTHHFKKQTLPDSVIQKLAALEELDLSDMKIECCFSQNEASSSVNQRSKIDNYITSILLNVLNEYFPSLKRLTVGQLCYREINSYSQLFGNFSYKSLLSQKSNLQIKRGSNGGLSKEFIDCMHVLRDRSSSTGQVVPRMAARTQFHASQPLVNHLNPSSKWFNFETFVEAIKSKQLHFGDQLQVTTQGAVRRVVNDITFYCLSKKDELYGTCKRDGDTFLRSKEKIKEIVLLRSVADMPKEIIRKVTASKDQPLTGKNTSELFLSLMRMHAGHIEKSEITSEVRKLLSQVTVIDLSDRNFTFKLGESTVEYAVVKEQINALFNQVLVDFFPACTKLILSPHSSPVLLEELLSWKSNLSLTKGTELKLDKVKVEVQEPKVVPQEELIFLK